MKGAELETLRPSFLTCDSVDHRQGTRAAGRTDVTEVVFAISGQQPLGLSVAEMKLPSVAFEKRLPRSVPQRLDLECR